MSKKPFKYVATSKGTLSNPYRFIEEGETVISHEEIKASWLVPASEFKKKAELPITPLHQVCKAGQGLPAPVDDAYQAQIDKLVENEQKQDQKSLEDDQKSQNGESGTGSKTVL
mgnify:CR=1 FL=1